MKIAAAGPGMICGERHRGQQAQRVPLFSGLVYEASYRQDARPPNGGGAGFEPAACTGKMPVPPKETRVLEGAE